MFVFIITKRLNYHFIIENIYGPSKNDDTHLCKHLFCNKCWKELITSNYCDKCPVCRRSAGILFSLSMPSNPSDLRYQNNIHRRIEISIISSSFIIDDLDGDTIVDNSSIIEID